MCVAVSPSSNRLAIWPFGRRILQYYSPHTAYGHRSIERLAKHTAIDRNFTAGHLSPCSRTTKIFQYFSCYHLYDIQINPITLYLKLNYYSFGTFVLVGSLWLYPHSIKAENGWPWRLRLLDRWCRGIQCLQHGGRSDPCWRVSTKQFISLH